jgi:hypothetical protein
VQRSLELVYGAGSVGLMGVLADAVLARGGTVTGVIPESLATCELMHDRLSASHVVADMHTRKATMARLSDAFIALPGGYGTLEELFEIVTFAQLGLHDKRIGLLDSGGFFAPLLAMLDHAVNEGFVRAEHRALIEVSTDPVPLLDALARPLPPPPGGAREKLEA